MLHMVEENAVLAHLWTAREVTAVLNRLEVALYTDAPFRPRFECVESICAIVAKYSPDVGR